MTREFIRLKVGTYRRKAFGTTNPDGTPRRPAYPAAALAAFYGVMELAAEQPTRGQFESIRLLKVLLEGKDGKGRAYARQVDYLLEHGDITVRDGIVYVDGWEAMQEGDYTVAERVHRFRTRHANGAANGACNGPSNGSDNDPHARARPSPRPSHPSESPSKNDVGTENGEAVFAVVNRIAFIRPDSGLGIRLYGLIERQGEPAVLAALDGLIPTRPTWSDRQLVLGLENILEAIPAAPSASESRQSDLEDQRAKRQARSEEQAAARRLEYFANTGKWDPAFGPEPTWRPEWGQRPAA